jgi:two-component system sensor histidine kinase/response regulator
MKANAVGYEDNTTLVQELPYLSKLKRKQQALEKKVQDLKIRNAELNAFVHIVAHELKNPLSSMICFASLVDQYHDRMSSDNILENVRTTIEVGQHMKTIIDGLLLLTKVEQTIPTEMTALDMHPIIEHVTRNLNSAIREHRAHIHLPQAWPTARGYTPWVVEVWTNYISNAIKYGGSPPVIRLGAEATTNGYIHFWVEDNGQGLSSTEQLQLFQPFVRLRKHEIEGSGLGLSVVKKIVQRLEGAVVLESEVGKGSRFGFTLPMA